MPLKQHGVFMTSSAVKISWFNRSLNAIERIGNKLPDPAILFALLMFFVWGLSWALSGITFTDIDPRTGQPFQVKNQKNTKNK